MDKEVEDYQEVKTGVSVDAKSILVVEDDQSISRLLRHNLQDAITRVTEAATGLDCIRAVNAAKIDIVILDLGLPDSNGWGILSLLRFTPSLWDMPVIMVSVEPPNVDLINNLRPNDYIKKPFDTRDLVARVRRVMNCA